jgi:Rhodopirellula transposase DDE domain
LVEPTTRGDPESPLRWTCKSVRRLAQALQAQGHQVSRTLVGELLNAAGYSLQANRKTKEGDSHPDRDAQFARITTQVAAALAEKQPVISVDTKKRNWSAISATTGANIALKPSIERRSRLYPAKNSSLS